MANWSAKVGERSSLHYGGEGVLIHPTYQGVCRWHGTEAIDVTQGGLVGCCGQGPQRAGAISEERNEPVCPPSRRRVEYYLKFRQQNLSDRKGGEGLGKATREKPAE